MNLSPSFDVYAVYCYDEVEIVFTTRDEAEKYIDDIDISEYLHVQVLPVWDNAEAHLS